MANEENPYDSIGYKHNEVLKHLLTLELDDTNMCNSLSEGSNEFNIDINLNCQEMLSIIDEGRIKTFDSIGNYQSDFFNQLLSSNKISQNEYYLIDTTIKNTFNESDLNQKIQLLKVSENYTINSQNFNEVEKGRILRTLAIYRYSSYYWGNESARGKNPMVELADAAAEYWAMNSPDSPAQDGGDVYLISGIASLIMDIIITYLMP